MPVFIVENHVELIDELLKIEDISREILEHIDMEEMDRMDRRKKERESKVEDKKRWKRRSNHYDSWKFCAMRR